MMKSSSLFFLCILWILFTALSNSVAMAYGFSLIQDSKSTWNEYFLRGLFISGFLSGLGQWVLMETRVKGTWMWVPLNILGIPLGLIIGHYLYSGFVSLAFAIMRKQTIPYDWTDTAYPFVVISVAGIVFGILQWLVLKKKVRFAYWWIPVSVLSWNIGLLLPYEIFGTLNPAMWDENWSISGAIFGIMLGGIVGAIGGITIALMLTNSNHVMKQVGIEHLSDAS